ncbi:winged helix-turn-helix transcriptional regulator [Methanobrevibacter millerae]
MFLGKKHFFEFKENKPNLSNNVLSDTLKSMEKNGLIVKKVSN